MSWLTDEEQKALLTDGPTTEKINKRLSAAEQRILEQIRPVVEKQNEIENKIDDFIAKVRRNFMGIVKG